MDDTFQKVAAGLVFDVSGALRQFEQLDKAAAKTFAEIEAKAAKTGLAGIYGDGATLAKSLNMQQVQRLNALKEGEAKAALIARQGETEITAIQAKEALTRQAITAKEAQTRLAIEKQMYMQSRREAFSENTGSFGNLIFRHATWLGAGLAVFETLDLVKQGLVDVETGMKGLSTVLPEIHHSQEAYNEATEEAIDLMQKYGASLDDVMNAGRSFGRMYKSVDTVMGLVNNSILMNVVDNVKLEEAVRGNEAALAVYGDGLETINEIMAFSNHTMDAWTRLSHESMASATDLLNITERASGAAKVAKTNFDQLMGLGASAVRATGLPGANIGRLIAA